MATVIKKLKKNGTETREQTSIVALETSGAKRRGTAPTNGGSCGVRWESRLERRRFQVEWPIQLDATLVRSGTVAVSTGSHGFWRPELRAQQQGIERREKTVVMYGFFSLVSKCRERKLERERDG